MATDFTTLLSLKVPIIVQVGSRVLTVEEVLSLGPGTILELEKSAEDELDLLVNNKSIGSGMAVKVGENFGIRVTNVESARDRAKAMGK